MTDRLGLDRAGRRLVAADGSTTRLHEKPFRLLVALLERRDRVVPREDLYRAVWPGTEHLDFEANLNATVLKLRRALDEPPGEPRWIETEPGLGYRLRSSPGAPTAEPPLGPPPPGRTRSIQSAVIAGSAIFGLLLLLAFLGTQLGSRTPEPGPATPQAERPQIRLGIVRFERTALGTELEGPLARAGESVLAELAAQLGDGAAVVGPRSTFPFEDDPFPRLQGLADAFSLDYVLNARLVDDGPERALIVELIRIADGGHPWVELFADPSDAERIVASTVDGVLGHLAAAEAPCYR